MLRLSVLEPSLRWICWMPDTVCTMPTTSIVELGAIWSMVPMCLNCESEAKRREKGCSGHRQSRREGAQWTAARAQMTRHGRGGGCSLSYLVGDAREVEAAVALNRLELGVLVEVQLVLVREVVEALRAKVKAEADRRSRKF